MKAEEWRIPSLQEIRRRKKMKASGSSDNETVYLNGLDDKAEVEIVEIEETPEKDALLLEYESAGQDNGQGYYLEARTNKEHNKDKDYEDQRYQSSGKKRSPRKSYEENDDDPDGKKAVSKEMARILKSIHTDLLPEIRAGLHKYRQAYKKSKQLDAQQVLVETLQRAHKKDSAIVRAVSDEYLSMDDEFLAVSNMEEQEIIEKVFEAKERSLKLQSQIAAKRKKIEQLQMGNLILKTALVKYLS